MDVLRLWLIIEEHFFEPRPLQIHMVVVFPTNVLAYINPHVSTRMSPPFLDPPSPISKLMGCSVMMSSGGEHNTDVFGEILCPT